MDQSLFLIMGSHLFPIKSLPSLDHKQIVMIEDVGLCTHFKYHKKKLLFFLEAMRNYADELRDYGYEVSYIPLKEKGENPHFFFHLEKELSSRACKNLESYEIEDRFFRNELQEFVDTQKLNWITHRSPLFLHSSREFLELFSSKKHPRLRPFYESERKYRDILMQGDQPAGGQFSFDQDNRKRLPQSVSVPKLPPVKHTRHRDAVCQIVNHLFADHPGTTEDFWLPVSREGAKQWLRVFLKERLSLFGPYEDAMSTEEPFVFHSALSPLLNSGLLTPEEVIDEALNCEGVPLNSIEGFIRQVLGWREFIRGIDECFGVQQETSNFFENERKLSEVWWTGETGLLPVDHVIKNVIQYGYCHHIERLMVLSNVMLLLEIHPQEVFRWFMELFIDSADWVMGPNVYGMGQFSDGGLFATKPYICGSNYLRKMSNFPKGEWCDIFDGLYWSFIDKRRHFFSSQPRLNMMLATLDRMSEERRTHLFTVAEAFRNTVTVFKKQKKL